MVRILDEAEIESIFGIEIDHAAVARIAAIPVETSNSQYSEKYKADMFRTWQRMQVNRKFSGNWALDCYRKCFKEDPPALALLKGIPEFGKNFEKIRSL